ncbi:MAG: VWA domain-containing protein [Chloracidobacterium sp.]|nr:VWA domain-containing protein [Chloracidobacterium sp.]
MKTPFYFAVFIFAAAAIALAAGGVTSSAQTAAGTQPSPTPTPSPKPTIDVFADTGPITVETELVNLNVRVIDRNNKPVNNLTEKDFKIFEDGVPQQIDFFSKSLIPTNYALVLDNSGSLRSQLEKVIEAGKVLVATNTPEDETAIIRFVGRDKISIEQDFTANKDDLNAELDNLYIEGGQTAIIDAVYLAVENVDQYEKSTSAADRKRRAIVLVTDGEDRDSYFTEKQLFDQLRESETQIYVIGFVDDLSKEGGFIGKSPQAKAKAFLQRMAEETGGKAYFPSSTAELNGIAKDIASELRTQFSIGYLPSNDRKDGTYRNIRVLVADGPNKEKRIAITRTGRVADNDDLKPGKTPAPTPPKKQ